MACPSQIVLNETLTLTIKTLDIEDNPEWADSLPIYTIYETSIDASNIVSGFEDIQMTQNTDITGSYYSLIDISDTSFSVYEKYIVVITTTVGGNDFSRTYTFTVVNQTDIIEKDTQNISAVAEAKGTFRLNTYATLFIKIINFDGVSVDPNRITCTITGPKENSSLIGDVVYKQIPFAADRGFYVYEWQILDTTVPGTYSIDWEYYLDDEEKHEYQNVVVAEEAFGEPTFYTPRFIGFRNALEHHICCAQSIPVYFEQARPSYDLKTFQFSFKNWNQSAGVRIYRNKQLIRNGVEVDYFNGKVRFSDSLLPQEMVHADYNFRWFSDEDLNRFLINALQTVNIFPPVSQYVIENVPDRFIPPILYGAAKDAIRQLLMCLQFQQPQQVFGGADKSQQAFQGLETLKQNYEKDWEKLVEQKKYGPYPSTMVISTPEYSLPGGRSRWFRYLFK